MKPRRLIWIAVVLAFSLKAPCVDASEEEFRIISTRPKVTQPFLLVRPLILQSQESFFSPEVMDGWDYPHRGWSGERETFL